MELRTALIIAIAAAGCLALGAVFLYTQHTLRTLDRADDTARRRYWQAQYGQTPPAGI
jgi:hypothetical protein